MAGWNDYEKIARRLDRIAKAFERIANALETANIIEADRKTEPIDREDVLTYIDRVSNSGLGKKKSLEYIRKYVEKTEPQFDKDINVRSKTEPQTEITAQDYERWLFKEPQTCDTCRYDKEPWHRQVCDECTVGESNWKPKDEPQTDCSWQKGE